MSFYTSLTGLNAAQSQLGITSNNVANVGTVGFKKSRAEFGDIFATSPLENASSAIGQGVLLKEVKQQFSQGNIEFSSNSLDLAISGQGFFALKPNLTSNQTVYTRAGSFSVNNDRYVVDSKGQYLQTFPVNEDGSVIATGLASAKSLQLPSTAGLPQPSSKIELGLNLPADAEIIPYQAQYDTDNPYAFDRNDTETFNKSTSITVYDSLGNPHIATVYYIKTSSATEADPTNKWDTKIYIGDEEMKPSLIPAKNDKSETLYMNKFGQTSTDPAAIDPTFNAQAAHPLYYNDDQQQKVASEPGIFSGGYMTRANVGHDFGSTDSNAVTIGTGAGAFGGTNFVSVSVDGSDYQSITIPEADYTGTELAAEMTRQLNSVFGDERAYLLGDAQTITLELQDKNGNDINKDALTSNGISSTPDIDITIPAATYTRESLVAQVQAQIDAATYYTAADPNTNVAVPVTVGYDLTSRSLTFTSTDGTFNRIKASSLTSDLGLDSNTAGFAEAGESFVGSQVVPKGDVILDPKEQRTGVLVSYEKDSHKFTFQSGTTGEASSIDVKLADASADNHLLGVGATYGTEYTKSTGTGLPSTAGTATSSKAGIDITGTFAVTSNDNVVNVTIDGIDGRVVVPSGSYTGHTFAAAMEERINLIQHADNREVNNVNVVFNADDQSFTITSGTVGTESSVNINGHSNWGFDATSQVRGTVPEVTVIQQARDAEGNLLYIDRDGNETTIKPEASPQWTPIYLDKGELTYDTFGKLISPKEGVQYSPFDPSNGSDLLNLTVDYGKFSTQY
ncbi:MAG: flagellar hook-basal body complex protein, partial [Gammaproteobacteria bacterium]|nr:flagellar hook-basal body complex protein [Gammaproteobacteria bacterium]